MSVVALATCARFPDLHDDDRPLLGALAERGVDATAAVWNDPTVDWDRFDLVVLRNTWDYTDHLDDFLAWTQSLPRLANPAPVIAWNVDKHYLADLAAAGVPTVPTTYVGPGEPIPALAVGEVVVKPTVSVGSRDTLRSTDPAQISAQVAAIVDGGRVAMVQPYLADVDRTGETAVIFLGGVHSHAARKAAQLTPGVAFADGVYLEESMSTRTASDAELAVARAALEAVAATVPAGDDLLYARVDLIPDPDGRPTVVEVEVTEPSLFLELGDDAVGRFAEAIAAVAADR